MRRFGILVVVLVLLFVGCQPKGVTPTAEPAAVATPSKTPQPTFTPRAGTAQPSLAPSVTSSAEPTLPPPAGASEPPNPPVANTPATEESPTAKPATPTQVPTQAPSPRPTKSLRMASPEYGMQIFPWWRPEVASRDMQMVRPAGFTWCKVGFGWRDIEGAGKGIYDWSRTDRIVETAAQEGLALLGGLG